jgi:hypothetical protein
MPDTRNLYAQEDEIPGELSARLEHMEIHAKEHKNKSISEDVMSELS